jgi:peroxiredoxin
MLRAGDKAPDFDAEATTGHRVRLSDYAGKRVALFFFPKAFTTGCTMETKHFRDAAPELSSLGVEVIGVSTDDLATQCRFADEQRATFPMLSDADHRIAKAFGVLWPIWPFARRVTFVIGPDGKIEAVFRHELQITRHIDDVRKHAQAVAAQ